MGRFLRSALMWRGVDREYALVGWGLIGGAAWLLVELMAGAGLEAALGFVLLALLTGVCAIDARFGIIPDSFVVSIAGIGASVQFIRDQSLAADRTFGAVLVFVAGYLLRASYRWWRGRDGFGLGDVKLLGASVLWLGLDGIPTVLLVGVLSASASLLVLLYDGHRLRGHHSIAFGPHLAIGVLWVWVAGPFRMDL